MSVMASQIASLKIVYSTFIPAQIKEVNSPHKGPVTRKMFPLDDVIIGAYAVK